MPDIAPPVTRPVRLHNYLAYGSNDVLGAGSMAVISGWVLIFYTQFCGLSAGQAATIFAVARILDAFASPMIGYISDHFGGTWLGQRFGRRRFFILAAIPLLPSFALMWLPGQGFWYYLVSYVLFELVYAMEIIPFETLAAEMSSDYRTKAKFAGSRILFGQASAILAGFLPLWLIEALGRDSADTFFYMGIIFAILFMATAGLLYAFSWERHLPAEAAAAARADAAARVRVEVRREPVARGRAQQRDLLVLEPDRAQRARVQAPERARLLARGLRAQRALRLRLGVALARAAAAAPRLELRRDVRGLLARLLRVHRAPLSAQVRWRRHRWARRAGSQEPAVFLCRWQRSASPPG